MKFHSKFLMLLVGLALCFSLSAQVGNTGAPIVDIENVLVCDDGTTVTMALQYVVGEAAPSLLGYFDEDGAAYTLSGNGVTVGACDGSGSATDAYAFQFDRLCDDGTPFYRIALFTNNTTTPTSVTDLELDLSTAYTVAGTVTAGPCAESTTTTLTRVNSSATGTVASGTLSFEICNEGTSTGTVTVGGTTSNLIPASCWSYSAVFNEASRQYRVTPAVTFDASGTTFTVTTAN